MTKPQINYIYRGQVERGNGGPGYTWHPGYSEDSEDGKPLFPWMTIAECRNEAKARGAKAAFLVDPERNFNDEEQTQSSFNRTV